MLVIVQQLAFVYLKRACSVYKSTYTALYLTLHAYAICTHNVLMACGILKSMCSVSLWVAENDTATAVYCYETGCHRGYMASAHCAS
jgi:hypothetical protein